MLAIHEWHRHQSRGGTFRSQLDFPRPLPGKPIDGRFWIEKIGPERSAIHEQVNDAFGSRREMGLPIRCRVRWFSEKIRQRHRAKPTGTPNEQIATRNRCHKYSIHQIPKSKQSQNINNNQFNLRSRFDEDGREDF